MARVNYRDSGGGGEAPRGLRAWFDDRPQLPYLIPFMAFVLVMMPATFGEPYKTIWRNYHPWMYGLKTVLAAILLFVFWNHYTRIRWTKLGLGVVAGLLGTVLWVGTEYLCQWIGLNGKPDPANFWNPDLMIPDQWHRWVYLCVRIVGPSLVVPIMEELFFRDFLMRAMVRGARFQDVAVGTFTWFSLIGMSVLFGINHGSQWPAGILYGLLMGVLLIRTKSLGACIVAHGVTNLSLYLYVVYRGDWQFM